MKIIRNYLTKTTLQDFAEEHDLTLHVRERDTNEPSTRFFAKFSECELKDGPILCCCFGNGRTEEEAIEDYTNQISRGLLVFRAWNSDRKEIRVPILTT